MHLPKLRFVPWHVDCRPASGHLGVDTAAERSSGDCIPKQSLGSRENMDYQPTDSFAPLSELDRQMPWRNLMKNCALYYQALPYLQGEFDYRLKTLIWNLLVWMEELQ